jgi:hypothetical protein
MSHYVAKKSAGVKARIIGNIPSEPALTPLAVEKHDGAGERGDVAGAWD